MFCVTFLYTLNYSSLHETPLYGQEPEHVQEPAEEPGQGGEGGGEGEGEGEIGKGCTK